MRAIPEPLQLPHVPRYHSGLAIGMRCAHARTHDLTYADAAVATLRRASTWSSRTHAEVTGVGSCVKYRFASGKETSTTE